MGHFMTEVQLQVRLIKSAQKQTRRIEEYHIHLILSEELQQDSLCTHVYPHSSSGRESWSLFSQTFFIYTPQPSQVRIISIVWGIAHQNTKSLKKSEYNRRQNLTVPLSHTTAIMTAHKQLFVYLYHCFSCSAVSVLCFLVCSALLNAFYFF